MIRDKKFTPHKHYCPSCDEHWDCENRGEGGRSLCEHSDDLYCEYCIVFGVKKVKILMATDISEKSSGTEAFIYKDLE